MEVVTTQRLRSSAAWSEWQIDLGATYETRAVSIFDMSLRPGISLREHQHESVHVCFILQGAVETVSGHHQLVLPRNAALFHPAGAVHSVQAGPLGARVLAVDIASEWLERFDGADGFARNLAQLDQRASTRYRATLLRELELQLPCSALMIEGTALELVGCAARSRGLHEDRRGFNRAMELLREEYSSPLTLVQVASRTGLRPHRLSAAFRKYLGKGLGAVVRDLRIDRVKELLSSEAPLADIAVATGFCDQAHCSRVFKELTGETLGQFRRGLRRRARG